MTSHNQLTIQYIKISKAEALNTTMRHNISNHNTMIAATQDLLHGTSIPFSQHGRQESPPPLEKPSHEPRVYRSTNYFLADICMFTFEFNSKDINQ